MEIGRYTSKVHTHPMYTMYMYIKVQNFAAMCPTVHTVWTHILRWLKRKWQVNFPSLMVTFLLLTTSEPCSKLPLFLEVELTHITFFVHIALLSKDVLDDS